MIEVLVVDRDRTTSEGIAAGLSAAEDVRAAHTARSVEDVRATLARPGVQIDVVVARAGKRGNELLQLARELRSDEDSPSLVVTGLPASEGVIVEYVEAGVDAYLTEELSISGLLVVLRLLSRGEVLVSPSTAYRLIQRLHRMSVLLEDTGFDVSALASLTSRESEVLELLGHELTNQEIAKRLYIGVGTVKSHVHSILKKLGVRGREDARRLLLVARSTEDTTAGAGS